MSKYEMVSGSREVCPVAAASGNVPPADRAGSDASATRLLDALGRRTGDSLQRGGIGWTGSGRFGQV